MPFILVESNILQTRNSRRSVLLRGRFLGQVIGGEAKSLGFQGEILMKRVLSEEVDQGESKVLPLSAVRSGSEVTLVSIEGGRGVRLKLVGMGLGAGMRITVLNARGSGPCVVIAGNRRLALGRGMAKKILVREETGS